MIMLIYIYHIFTTLLTPIYIFLLLARLIKKKEIAGRVAERFAVTRIQRPRGNLIWIHAASVGESIAALTLIDRLNSVPSEISFLVTSLTTSSAKILQNKLPTNAIHQFLPFDNIVITKRFLAHWQPNLAIFIESELWPCLITESAKRFKLLLLNARISDKSFFRWKKLAPFFCSFMNNFSEIIVQSSLDFEKFQIIGLKNIVNLGNIKFANKKLISNQFEYTKLSQHFLGKKIIVAASTHLEDEKIILNIVSILKKQFLNCYFIIIPRHPERKNELIKLCRDRNLAYNIRSKSPISSLDTDVYIVDSFGELGLFYSLAYISFIGGSFNLGGHNPIEAAHFGNLILFGSDMSNFQIIANEMVSSGSAIQINSQQELLEKLQYYLSAEGIVDAEIYQKNSVKFVQRHQYILDQYLAVIGNYIPLVNEKKLLGMRSSDTSCSKS